VNDTELLLAAIVGGENTPAKVELRTPTHGSEWFSVRDLERAATAAVRLGQHIETWVGMAPRQPYLSPRTGRQFGGSAAVERAWILSADCDTDAALERLAKFTPSPTFVVASGSLTNGGERKVHAHWVLREPIGRKHFVTAKKRLVKALSSDPKITDAARVMRLPGTINHKTGKPVELIEQNPKAVYVTAQVLASTPEVRDAPSAPTGARRETAHNARAQDGQPRQLQEQFSPREYVAELAGVEVGADGKACCPFHDDTSPSLHAYIEPERGWYCYGCNVGGDIYTFAGMLRGIPQRELHGATFIRVWEHLRTFYGLPVDA
jgi:hypothetical protein